MVAAAPAPREVAGDAPPEGGLRGLLGAAIDTLRTRLDLAAVEVEIVLRTLVHIVVWAVAAACCVLFAMFFGVTAVILALWDTHRMVALLAGSLVFVGLAVVCGWVAARTLRTQPGMLEGTLEQLKEDRHHDGGAP
jgi:uncharacterized membrane protein YqjE